MFGIKHRFLIRKNGFSGSKPRFADIFAANPYRASVKKSVLQGIDLANIFVVPARVAVQKAINVNPIVAQPVKTVVPVRPEMMQRYQELESLITATPPERKPSEAELAALESLARIKADLERMTRANDALAAKGIRPTTESDLKPAASGSAHSLRMYSGQLLERMFGGGNASHERECDKAYGNTPNQSRRPGALSL